MPLFCLSYMNWMHHWIIKWLATSYITNQRQKVERGPIPYLLSKSLFICYVLNSLCAPDNFTFSLWPEVKKIWNSFWVRKRLYSQNRLFWNGSKYLPNLNGLITKEYFSCLLSISFPKACLCSYSWTDEWRSNNLEHCQCLCQRKTKC